MFLQFFFTSVGRIDRCYANEWIMCRENGKGRNIALDQYMCIAHTRQSCLEQQRSNMGVMRQHFRDCLFYAFKVSVAASSRRIR